MPVIIRELSDDDVTIALMIGKGRRRLPPISTLKGRIRPRLFIM